LQSDVGKPGRVLKIKRIERRGEKKRRGLSHKKKVSHAYKGWGGSKEV